MFEDLNMATTGKTTPTQTATSAIHPTMSLLSLTEARWQRLYHTNSAASAGSKEQYKKNTKTPFEYSTAAQRVLNCSVTETSLSRIPKPSRNKNKKQR